MKCIFTGKDADTSEHVIPKWLQKRFSLSNQMMVIPNGTALKYKHHRVPADTDANNLFGKIEKRISQGTFDPAEVYLWALKIHIGCIYRDASLRFDVKESTSPFILDAADFDQEIWLFQQLFHNWANGGHTDPSPLGSVFVVDSLNPTSDFDFMHCLTTGTVGVDIGGKFVLVLLWDQGDASHSNILDLWTQYHVPRVKSLAGSKHFEDNCYMATHVWACEAAYSTYRHRRPHSMITTPTQITLVPPLGRPKGKPPEETEYRHVCRSFGLDLVEYNGEVNNVYQPFRAFNRVPSA